MVGWSSVTQLRSVDKQNECDQLSIGVLSNNGSIFMRVRFKMRIRMLRLQMYSSYCTAFSEQLCLKNWIG